MAGAGDFTNQYISGTYHRVLQLFEGTLVDGTGSYIPVIISGNLTVNGNIIGSIESASYVPLLAGPNITINYQANGIAISASDSPPSVSASYAQTASSAISASYVQLAAGPGVTINYEPSGRIAISSSADLSALNSFTGSIQTQVDNLTANTSSYFLNSNTGSFVSTSSFNSFTGSYNTGSFTGSFTGSLLGTSSWAISSSYVSSSNVYGPFGFNSILSASHSETSSYSFNSNNATTASSAVSASYVSLIAGTNITINYQAAGIVISASVSTGSSFTVDNNIFGNLLISSGSSVKISGESNLFWNGSNDSLQLGSASAIFNSESLFVKRDSGDGRSFDNPVLSHKFLFGRSLISSVNFDVPQFPQVVIGQFNATESFGINTASQQAFVIGGGLNNTDRRNLFSVTFDGTCYISRSLIVNNISGSLTGTASYAFTSSVANFATLALSASYASSSSLAVSSSYAFTASSAISSSLSISSSRAEFALSSSYASTSSIAVSASYAVTASSAVSASYSLRREMVQFSIESDATLPVDGLNYGVKILKGNWRVMKWTILSSDGTDIVLDVKRTDLASYPTGFNSIIMDTIYPNVNGTNSNEYTLLDPTIDWDGISNSILAVSITSNAGNSTNVYLLLELQEL